MPCLRWHSTLPTANGAASYARGAESQPGEAKKPAHDLRIARAVDFRQDFVTFRGENTPKAFA
jgi:hypothetical protein